MNLSDVESISTTRTTIFNPSLLTKDGIEEVWRIIDEQSEFISKVFDSYKENVIIPSQEIWSYLHFFHNIAGFFSWEDASNVSTKESNSDIFPTAKLIKMKLESLSET